MITNTLTTIGSYCQFTVSFFAISDQTMQVNAKYIPTDWK
jgi:hypothetical protein